MSNGICIVLACHDGAEYLAAQLDSLLGQTLAELRVLALDDRSTDATASMLAGYAASEPRIRIIDKDPMAPSSALASYAQLLQAALDTGAEYIFCADQDDVWLPHKLETLLLALQAAEGPARTPALLHHDLEVVDASLATRAASFWAYMGLSPGDEANPQRLLSRNEVTGCALACNRALLELALPVSGRAIMHDWWLALWAGHCGVLRAVPDRLVRYRQHGANAIGAKSYWHGLNPLGNWAAGWRRGNAEFLATVDQAEAFRDALAGRLDNASEPARALGMYVALPSLSRWQRLQQLRRCGVWRQRWLLDAVLVLRMLLLSRA